jgi:hypothetical protein
MFIVTTPVEMMVGFAQDLAELGMGASSAGSQVVDARRADLKSRPRR